MMKDTLREVLTPFGPSGGEGPIGKVLGEMVRPHVNDVRTDALGNVICTKKGRDGGKRIMFSAHMDTIGYIVVDADKEGFLRVANIGGVRPATAAGRHVVLANGVTGVISGEPLTGTEPPTIQKLFVDIGAASREEALEKAPVGTLAVVAYQFTDMGDRVCAPYMDDRAACAVLVELMRALGDTPHEVVAVFSTQEEVGCRGAGVAAFAIEPDIGVAIDVTPTGDTPGTDTLPVKMGQGPADKVKDSTSIATPMVRDGLVGAHGGSVRPSVPSDGGRIKPTV